MENSKPILRYVKVSFLLLIVFTIIMPKTGHVFDTKAWTDWAGYIFENGLGSIFNSKTDYFPLYHYILNIYILFQDNTEEIQANIYYLKVFTLVFHFATGYFIYRLVKQKEESWDTAMINTLFYLLNIAVLYNVVIWGQVDVILACFVFISVYFAIKQSALISLIFLLLALNFKPHAIIFVPILTLMLLPGIIFSFRIKKLIVGLLILAAIQLVIFLPFILDGSIHNLTKIEIGRAHV